MGDECRRGRMWRVEGWERRIEMPKLTVDGLGTVEVAEGKRLVLALEEDLQVDQLHACGGVARCTTCRVQFVSGEPEMMTEAERAVLTAKGLIGKEGLRLSCQIKCDGDMMVQAISRLDGSGRKDVGGKPKEEIEPVAVWGRK
jgi:ferredoxin